MERKKYRRAIWDWGKEENKLETSQIADYAGGIVKGAGSAGNGQKIRMVAAKVQSKCDTGFF